MSDSDADADADFDADEADTDGTVRCWLAERDYDERNLITLIYATPEGDRAWRKQQSATVMNQQGSGVTAAVDVDPDDLDRVVDAEDRQRYAAEASRMAAEHDPDDVV